MYDLEQLGKRLFNARRNKKLTQVELCEIMSIDQSTYSKMENGKYDITISQLYELSSILNVSIMWLIGENPKTFEKNMSDAQLLEYIHHIISIRK